MLRIVLLFFLSLVACARPATRARPASHGPSVPPLALSELEPGLYLHRSWKALPEGVFASNGLLLARAGEAVLIDTPWSAEDTELLLERAHGLGLSLRAVLVTHAHDDRVAGLDVLARRQVVGYGNARTARQARASRRPAPSRVIPDEGTLTLAGNELSFFYPGPAHAPDNMVVYLPAQRTLFGGCMVRALDAGLGPLGEADLAQWRLAIDRVEARYPDAERVVPGHGEPGGRELLRHTRALLDAKSARDSGG